jgi:hypothetical protein
MPDHPNAQRIMAAKTGVTPGKNIDPMFAVQAPEMVAHIPGTGPIAGEWTSREELAAAVKSLGERVVEGSLHIAPNVVATDGFAINVQRITAAQPDGRRLDTVLTEVWRFRTACASRCGTTLRIRRPGTPSGNEAQGCAPFVIYAFVPSRVLPRGA